MADNMMLKNVLGDDYQQATGNAKYTNGQLRYFNIDIDQAGKYFFDLTDAFNASVDEGNKIIPIRLNRGGEDINLNGYIISMDGLYPDRETPFSVTSSVVSASPAYIRFNLPLGLFQAVGVYTFQFTFKNATTGEVLKSHWQFFNVTQSATNMAIDLNNGIKPFDSEYMEWKEKVENQVSSLSTSVNTLQGLVDTYTKNVNTAVDNAWNSKLNGENTWTGKQHFNEAEIGNLTVDEGLDAKKDLTVEQGLHVKGSADLPSNTVINNDFSIMDTLRVNNRGISGDVTAYLNDTANYSSKKSSWLWADRIENNMNGNSFPMFRLHMAFTISGKDVGKPVAQFNSGFFEGQTNGPFTVPCKGGTVRFHIDADASTLILDSVDDVSGIASGSGSATIGTCQWL